MAEFISKRAKANKINGSLGGIKTARTHSAEFLEQRASKAGLETKDRYGSSFFAFIRSKRKNYSRKAVIKDIIPELTNIQINKLSTLSSVELMRAATSVFNEA